MALRNKLVTEDELLKTFPLDKREGLLLSARAAIREAIVLVELMTGTPVLEKKVDQKVSLGSDTIKLDDFPVKDIRLNGAPNMELGERADLGLVFLDVPFGDYICSYTVGYKDGEFPTLLRNLINNLVRYRFSHSEEALVEAKSILMVMRNARKELSLRREKVWRRE